MTTTQPALPTPASSTRHYYLKLLTIILTLKLLLLALDHTPMFFLGDSLSYLYTAISDWIPADRSFLYGYLIRIFAVPTASLLTLLLAQTLASSLSAFLIAYILRKNFHASPSLAATLAILCSLEPLQLLYERYIMTETFALLAFALFTAIALSAIQRPNLKKIALLQLAAVLLVALRVSFLPLIEAATLLVPLLAIPALKTSPETFPHFLRKLNPLLTRRPTRFLLHLALSLLLFLTFQNIYKRLYSHLIQHELPNAPPAYYYENGYHLLAFVLPIVKPTDFPDQQKAPQIFNHPAFDPADYLQRDKHRWWPNGIIDRIKSAYPNPLQSNHLADQTAWNALRRNPLAELPLALFGYADYFNPTRLHAGLLTDQGGDRPLPPELLTLLHDHFPLTPSPNPNLPTLTNRYFFLAWPWYLALLLLPFPTLIAILKSPHQSRPALLLLLTFILLQLAIIAAFSLSPTVRFLHPTAWLAMIILGLLLPAPNPTPAPPKSPP